MATQQQSFISDKPFQQQIRATSSAEPWLHETEDMKLSQYGWRCTTQEDTYKSDTLLGNWVEDRFDLNYLKKQEPLRSQFAHYYGSTYDKNYNSVPITTVPEVLKNLKYREPFGHPKHQPELDAPSLKATYQSWATTQRVDYLDPRLRKQPLFAGQKYPILQPIKTQPDHSNSVQPQEPININQNQSQQESKDILTSGESTNEGSKLLNLKGDTTNTVIYNSVVTSSNNVDPNQTVQEPKPIEKLNQQSLTRGNSDQRLMNSSQAAIQNSIEMRQFAQNPTSNQQGLIPGRSSLSRQASTPSRSAKQQVRFQEAV